MSNSKYDAYLKIGAALKNGDEEKASDIAKIIIKSDRQYEKDIEFFKDLEYNWNGYGAEPIPEKLIVCTENLLQNLSELPDVFPTANKSIQIEYEKANGEYLEFEMFEDDRVHMFRINSDGTEYNEEFQFDFQKIDRYVREFYGRI